MGEPRGSSRKSRAGSAAMRALHGARDLYVRGLMGFDRLLAAANPRSGMGRPTSRVFGIGGDRWSEQELGALVRAMQARRGGTSTGAAGSEAAEASAPAAMRGATPLERINEDAAVLHQTS